MGAVRSGIGLIGIVVLLIVVWQGSQLLLMVFAGVLFGILLDALANWTAGRTRLSRGWSLALVLILLSCLAVIFAIQAFPGLAAQAGQLAEQLPEAVHKVRSAIESSPLSRLFPGGGRSQAVGSSIVSGVVTAASAAMDLVVAAVVILFVGIYVAAAPNLYLKAGIRLIPPGKRERARQVLAEMGRVLQRWILARIVLMVVNGSATTIGLWIIGIPLAPILGLIAGLLNFVPNIGPFIAAVPAILIAFSQSLTHAAYTALLYLVLQMLDGYVFTPLAQHRAVSLAPALIISFQVLMGMLAGALGLLLATPIATALVVLIRMLYVEGALEDGAGT